jgi:hemerythrin-like domain-containing protein
MKNIFEAISEDHDIQRDLCKRILDTSGKTKDRKQLWKALKAELQGHEIAEERHFYKPLIDNDMMIEHARHGVAEHHEIDELIAKVDEADMDSSAWLTYAKQLAEKVKHHLEDEEHSFFQLAGKVFTEKQKMGLSKDYQASMKEQR